MYYGWFEMRGGRGLFIGISNQSGTSRVAARVSLRMAPDACAAAPRAPHVRLHVQDTCRTPPLLPDVRLYYQNSCKAPQQHTHVDQHASVACAETPRAWSIHLVLLHVRLHVLLPCTVTPRASVDTQLLRWQLSRPGHIRRDTSSFLVGLRDF